MILSGEGAEDYRQIAVTRTFTTNERLLIDRHLSGPWYWYVDRGELSLGSKGLERP